MLGVCVCVGGGGGDHVPLHQVALFDVSVPRASTCRTARSALCPLCRYLGPLTRGRHHLLSPTVFTLCIVMLRNGGRHVGMSARQEWGQPDNRWVGPTTGGVAACRLRVLVFDLVRIHLESIPDLSRYRITYSQHYLIVK